MSRGPGKIQRKIISLFSEYSFRQFTVEELCRRVFDTARPDMGTLPLVKTVADLPANTTVGNTCRVEESGHTYVFEAKWVDKHNIGEPPIARPLSVKQRQSVRRAAHGVLRYRLDDWDATDIRGQLVFHRRDNPPGFPGSTAPKWASQNGTGGKRDRKMSGNAKPTRQPLDLEQLRRLCEALPTVQIAEVVAGLQPALEETARRRLEVAIRSILISVHINLHFEKQPTRRLRAELAVAVKHLCKSISLSPESRAAMAAIAHQEAKAELVPTNGIEGFTALDAAFEEARGASRLAGTLAALEKASDDLTRWAEQAIATCHPGKPGRPPQQTEQVAVDGVRDAWREAYGQEPTLGPFLVFLNAVLKPTVEAMRGKPVNFEAAARSSLYIRE
jgi:hypothetical protein